MKATPAWRITVRLNIYALILVLGATWAIPILIGIGILLDPSADLVMKWILPNIFAAPPAALTFLLLSYRLELTESHLTSYGPFSRRPKRVKVADLRPVDLEPQTTWSAFRLVFDDGHERIYLGHGINIEPWNPRDLAKIFYVLHSRGVEIKLFATTYSHVKPGAPPPPISWFDVGVIPIAAGAALGLGFAQDGDWHVVAILVPASIITTLVAGRFLVGRRWTPPPGAIPE